MMAGSRKADTKLIRNWCTCNSPGKKF